MVNGSYIMGFILFSLKLQKQKLSQALRSNQFFLKKATDSYYSNTTRTFKTSSELFSHTQIARSVNKNSNLNVFL